MAPNALDRHECPENAIQTSSPAIFAASAGSRCPWGTILRLIRVDPDTPPFMLSESACHTECLLGALRPKVELSFHRYWNDRAPMLDDDADIDGKPCAMCALDIAPAELFRLRVHHPHAGMPPACRNG